MQQYDFSLAALEALSSISLTAMSTVLAVVALVFNYRQSAGWKPMIMVSKSILSGQQVAGSMAFGLKVEFWNRRKYPVLVRGTLVEPKGFEVQSVSDASDPVTSMRKNYWQHLEVLVPPDEHYAFTPEFIFDYLALEPMRPRFKITVHYFDPRTGKGAKAEVTDKFMYPHLGWRRSKRERARLELEARQGKLREGNT